MMRASTFLQRFPLFFLAAVLVALSVFVGGDAVPPAQAQTPTVLVSNTGQTDTVAWFITSNYSVAQGFTTGAASGGYTLGSIAVALNATNITEAQRDTIRAELWSATSAGAPDSKLHDLTVPAHPISTGAVSFAAPANTTLAASTKYYAVFYTVGGFDMNLDATATDGQDSGGAVGWTIANGAHNVQADAPTSTSTWSAEWNNSLFITVTEAEAETSSAVTLVSNLGQTGSGSTAFSGQALTVMQFFETGADTDGYALGSITAQMTASSALTQAEVGRIKAELWEWQATAKTADLTVPADIANASGSAVRFVAPEGTVLKPSTGYGIAIYVSSAVDKLSWHRTSSNNEDAGAATGWSIGDENYTGATAPGTTLTRGTDVFLISVTEAETSQTVPAAPVWSATFTPPERVDIGVGCFTVSQCTGALTDNSFAVGGTTFSMLSIELLSTSRRLITAYSPDVTTALDQLKFCVGPRAFTLANANTKTGDTRSFNNTGLAAWAVNDKIQLSIGNTCPPGQPTGLGATAGAASLDLAWTAPTVGTATGYDVHYTSAPSTGQGAVDDDADASGSDPGAAWVAVDRGTEADPPAATQSLTSLTPGTTYRVRVRATNIGGNVGWVRTTGTPTAATQSTNANLSGLTASGGASAGGAFTAFDLTPAFDAATTSYSATVANSVTHAKLTPTVAGPVDATMVQVGPQGGTLTTVVSGNASAALALSVGANAFTVRVTAEDGVTTKDHTVTITRLAQDTPPPATVTVSLSASPTTVNEGSSVTVTATLSAAQTSAVTIPVTITDNTAESGDHGALTSIAISANSATGTGTITTAQDAGDDHEVFTVSLGTPLPTGITAGTPSSVRITIRDDEATVPGAVTGLSVVPGYSRLALSWTAPAGDVTGYEVHYTTHETVADGADPTPYYPSLGWVDARHTGTAPSRTISGLPPEAHRVRVRAENGSGFGPWVTGAGTPMPRAITVSLSASPNPLVEGGDVTLTAKLEIGDLPTILQYDFFIPLRVTRETSEEGDHGSVDGISISKYNSSGTAVIPTHRDGDGDDEFFTVSIGVPQPPVRVKGGAGSVRVRIAEREPPLVTLAASPNPVHEGNEVTLTARLSQAMSTDLTVLVTVTRVDSEEEDHGTVGSITIPRGQTAGTRTIATTRDEDTDDERFTVSLGSVPLPAAAGSPTSVEVTIADRTEPEPVVPADTFGLLSVSPSPAQEGTTVTLTATLDDPAPSGGIVVTFLTAGEGSSPASADDYTLTPSTGEGGSVFQDRTPEITIPEGERTATATLSITADGVAEGDETLKVQLSVRFPGKQVGYPLTLTIQDAAAASSTPQNDPCDNCGTGGDTGGVSQGQAQYAALIAQMYEWRNDPEWVSEKAHTDRWDRALLAFGETVADTTLSPMTAAEAQGFADRGWERWVEVAAALRVLQNQAPTVSAAIADVTIVSESGTRQVSLSGVFDDPDGDSLTISATSSDEATATASVSSDGSTLTVTARLRGAATITVTAADSYGGTVSDSFTVTVKAAPVVASAISDVSGLETGDTQDVSLSGVFSDADGDSLTITAASDEEAIVTVSVSSDGSTLTLAGEAGGTATVTVTAEDSDGNRVSDAFQVSVPAESKYAALIARMYQWRNDPQWVSEKPHTDRWDRALLAFGETVADTTLTPMTAAEAQGFADRGWERWVEVAAALRELENQAPTVSASIADVTIVSESGTKEVSLSGVFDDPDGDSLTISAASSDGAVATVSVSSGGSSLTVNAQARGTATVTVTASDGNGGTAEDAFTVTVKAAPAVASAINDVSGLEAGSTQDVSLSGVFSDADGDALTVTAASGTEAVATVSVSSDGSTLTLTGVAEGTATITVTAQDSDGNRVTDGFDVSVVAQQQPPEPPNQAPTVSTSISDETIVNESGTKEVSLSGVFSDADNDSLTVTASSSDEAKATVSVSSGGSSLTVNAQARGTAVITVTAADGNGGTVSDTFTVTVKAAPTVASAIADMSLKAGATQEEGGAQDVSLAGVFSDADGDSLTFSAETSDFEVAEVFLLQGTLTVLAVAGGSATITVTAQDSDGNTVSDTFDVSVVGPPTAVSNLSCVAQTGQALFQWDAPEWSGAEVYAYDYDLTRPDGKREQARLQGYPLVRAKGEYQAGQEASISVKAVYELADGSQVSSAAAALTCTVAE